MITNIVLSVHERTISSGHVPTWTNGQTIPVRKRSSFRIICICSTPPNITNYIVNSNPCRYWFSLEILLENRSTGEIVTIVTIDNTTGAVSFSPSVNPVWVAGQTLEILTFNRDNFNYVTYSSYNEKHQLENMRQR